MKVGLVQYSPLWEDKKSNQEKILKLLKVQSEKFDLIVFPEMTLTGFSMKPDNLAEEIKGDTFNFFSSLALKNNCNVLAGMIETDSGMFYNTLIHVTEEGELKNHYRKVHPFSYSDEDKHYAAGNKIVTTEINGWKTGLSICYDLRFPEIYRLYAKERIQLLVDIANWPDTRIEHWLTLLKARAIENQCYVIGVNRVGRDPKLNYNGFSSVFNPMGKEIVSVKDDEKIVVADIDKTIVDETRNSLPFLEDIKLI